MRLEQFDAAGKFVRLVYAPEDRKISARAPTYKTSDDQQQKVRCSDNGTVLGSSLKDAVKWNRRRLPEGRSGSPGFDAAVWVDRFPELVDDLGDFWCHGHSSPVL